MQTYDRPKVQYGWWAGNARFAEKSGLFIAAHVGQAALTMFFAGAFTLFELSRYNAATPMGMASVNSLEDIIGGHLWIGVILLVGGAWHILVAPTKWAVKILRIEADAILSYSLGGLAFMALVSCAFVGFNTTAFPIEFYGIVGKASTVWNRSSAAGSQFFLAITALVSHLWQAYRARMVGVAA